MTENPNRLDVVSQPSCKRVVEQVRDKCDTIRPQEILLAFLLFLSLLLNAYLLLSKPDRLGDIGKEKEQGIRAEQLADLTLSSNTPATIISEIEEYINIWLMGEYQFAASDKDQWWIADDDYTILVSDAASTKVEIMLDADFDGLNSEYAISQEINNKLNVMLKNNGFSYLSAKSSKSMMDDRFYHYILSFEKEGIKCNVTTNQSNYSNGAEPEEFYFDITLSCSDGFDEAYQAQLPYLEAVYAVSEKNAGKKLAKNYVIYDLKTVDDSFMLKVGYPIGGYNVLGKLVNEKPVVVFSGRDRPECKLMEENEIPQELYEECYGEAGVMVGVE